MATHLSEGVTREWVLPRYGPRMNWEITYTMYLTDSRVWKSSENYVDCVQDDNGTLYIISFFQDIWLPDTLQTGRNRYRLRRIFTGERAGWRHHASQSDSDGFGGFRFVYFEVSLTYCVESWSCPILCSSRERKCKKFYFGLSWALHQPRQGPIEWFGIGWVIGGLWSSSFCI